MSRVSLLAGYLVLVFLGGGLLAPWLWWVAQSAAGTDAPNWIQGLARQPFHRFVHRSVLVLALVGLIPLARGWGLSTWRAAGLGRDPRWMRQWLTGLGVGLGMFAVIILYHLAVGVRVPRPQLTPASALTAILPALISALVVGILEEILFRGVLCGGLRRGLGWWPALVISSFVYSVVHFFQRPPAPESVSWWSGLEVVQQMLRGILLTDRLVPGGITLFLAGVLLGYLYRSTGTLYCSMGLHSGWVFLIQWGGKITAPGPAWPSKESGFRGALLSDWLTLITVVIFFLMAVLWMRRSGDGKST